MRKLLERWAEEAEALRERYALESAARVCEAHMRELADAVEEARNAVLTVSEAADECGYSKQHLRSLLSSGEIPNAGRKGRPRIRRKDLPPPKATTRTRKNTPRGGDGGSFDARRIVHG